MKNGSAPYFLHVAWFFFALSFGSRRRPILRNTDLNSENVFCLDCPFCKYMTHKGIDLIMDRLICISTSGENATDFCLDLAICNLGCNRNLLNRGRKRSRRLEPVLPPPEQCLGLQIHQRYCWALMMREMLLLLYSQNSQFHLELSEQTFRVQPTPHHSWFCRFFGGLTTPFSCRALSGITFRYKRGRVG